MLRATAFYNHPGCLKGLRHDSNVQYQATASLWLLPHAECLKQVGPRGQEQWQTQTSVDDLQGRVLPAVMTLQGALNGVLLWQMCLL